MSPDPDGYAACYAEKLWNLLPAAYRAADSEEFGQNGPLREFVDRIGAQAAVLRRGIDRLWEDQSIESCDDWVIPYLGDLLAVNLVAALDARGQRLDVAKAIHYRRRKGTVPLLEELTFDITEWPARVVEFFRRLGRTRHGLDPALGLPAAMPDPAGARALREAQGLVGARTRTPLGGYADLRNAHGASRAGTAFDEFSHTADARRGLCRTGWHNIPRLGVFLWRLRSFPVGPTTPVFVTSCPNTPQYTFDPTGRDVPLFAAGERPTGDAWVAPAEWQMPTPIDPYLLASELQHLYGAPPGSLAVYRTDGNGSLVEKARITADPRQAQAAFFIDPVRGRLIARAQAPAGAPRVTYHYGFSSLLGAGPYDRRRPGIEELPVPGQERRVSGGGDSLYAKLAALPATGTVTVEDFLTYDRVSDLGAVRQVTLRAENQTRPVIRLAPTLTWTMTGAGADSELFLEGLFLSGGTLVLAGEFARVVLRCCTLDPGGAGEQPGTFARSADGRDLAPCRLVVTGTVGELALDRCITGPVLVKGGELERLSAAECILQALGTERALDLPAAEARLGRCTLLGPASIHRLHASECILYDKVEVDDTQGGCVRFSAWAAESVGLPRQYESVALPPGAGLFASRVFGRPTYARLLAGADPRVAAGAADGSEMGAFAREKNLIKERSLRIKYQEYMPLGLTPVLIDVT